MAQLSKRRKRENSAPSAAPQQPQPAQLCHPSRGRRPRLIAAAILLCTVLAYIPAFRATYVWDDADHLPATNLERSLTGLSLFWFKLGATPQYYPLTHTTFWVESNLWGSHPAGYHAVNVMLHGLNAVLLWRLLRRLEVPGALVAAMVFALHPVHVESVAWISERKNVQSGFFYLAAAIAYVRFAGIGSPPDETPDRRRWLLYAAALALYACAVFSKTVTTSLPAALVLVLWWKHKLDRRQWLLLAPMFAFALVMGRITAGMEQWNVGAVGRHWDELSLVDRSLIAGRAAWFYAGKLVWPHPLIFTYPRWHIDPSQVWQFAFPAAAVLLVVALWLLRHRLGRGPLVAVLFFGGTLFPALGFVNVYPMRFSFVADHFQYLASVGLIALFVATLTLAFARARLPVAGGHFAVASVALVLAVLTFRQSRIYYSAETLWRYVLAKNEKAWLAHANLAAALEARGAYEEAAKRYARSLEIEPDQVHGHLMWGGMLERQADVAGAEAHYRAAAQIEPDDVRPAYALGRLAERRGDVAAAAAMYEAIVAKNPKFERARLDLASLLLAQGRTAEAMGHFQTAIELNPYSVEARTKAAGVLFRTGYVADAIRYLTEAQSLGDDTPQTTNNLGVMLMQSARPAEAAEQFRRAIAKDPTFAQAHYNLGNALQALGDRPGAIASYRQAVRWKPDFAAARADLERLTGQP